MKKDFSLQKTIQVSEAEFKEFKNMVGFKIVFNVSRFKPALNLTFGGFETRLKLIKFGLSLNK